MRIDWAHSPQFYHLQHTLKHFSVASILSLTQNGYSNKKVLNSEISLNLFLLKVESLFMSGFLGRLLAERMLKLENTFFCNLFGLARTTSHLNSLVAESLRDT